jgi:hypothetical protein
MNRNVFYVLAFVLMSPFMMRAQSAPAGYDRITCLKAQPGKQAELAQFQNDVWKKLVHVEVDEGEASAAYLLRTVFPGGEEAYCDYITVIVYPGVPPPPGPEHLTGLIKKAGIDMNVDAYDAKVRELAQVVSSELWRPLIIVGAAQKGDYLYLNFMKVHETDAYFGLERNMWKPMAEAFIKDGIMSAWFLVVPFLPSGTAGYQAVSVDVFPSWEKALKGIYEVEKDTFKRVHPNMQMSDFEAKIMKARDLDRRYLLTVEEKITSSSAQR